MSNAIAEIAKSLLSKLIPSRKSVDQRLQAQRPQTAARTTDQEYAQQPFYRIPDDTPSHRRLKTIIDCWQMYLDDDRVRSTIRGLAEDFVRRGVDRKPMSIKVVTDDKGEAEEIRKTIDDVLTGLRIYDRLDNIARGTLIEGSRYYRHVVDLATNRIVAFKKLPGPREGFLTTGPIDSADERINGGYVLYDTKSRSAVNFFHWWEIAAFHWDYDEDMGFGLPLYASGRINYERLKKIERAMAKARERQGYNRLAFENLGFANPDDLRSFIAEAESTRIQKGDTEGMSDVYSSGSVRQINAANSALFNIGDIDYSQAKLQESGLRPKSLGGSGGVSVNRAVLEVQYDDYTNGVVMDGEAMLETGLMMTVNVQMALLGRDVGMTPVQFVWPPKHLINTALIVEAREANTAGKLSDTTYLQMFKTSFERERQLIEQERKALAEERERSIEVAGPEKLEKPEEPEKPEKPEEETPGTVEASRAVRRLMARTSNGRLRTPAGA